MPKISLKFSFMFAMDAAAIACKRGESIIYNLANAQEILHKSCDLKADLRGIAGDDRAVSSGV